MSISFPCGSAGKESTCTVGDLGLIPESGRSHGEGNGNPLQYSCPENSMDRRARCPWGWKESGTTEQLTFLLFFFLHIMSEGECEGLRLTHFGGTNLTPFSLDPAEGWGMLVDPPSTGLAMTASILLWTPVRYTSPQGSSLDDLLSACEH